MVVELGPPDSSFVDRFVYFVADCEKQTSTITNLTALPPTTA